MEFWLLMWSPLSSPRKNSLITAEWYLSDGTSTGWVRCSSFLLVGVEVLVSHLVSPDIADAWGCITAQQGWKSQLSSCPSFILSNQGIRVPHYNLAFAGMVGGGVAVFSVVFSWRRLLLSRTFFSCYFLVTLAREQTFVKAFFFFFFFFSLNSLPASSAPGWRSCIKRVPQFLYPEVVSRFASGLHFSEERCYICHVHTHTHTPFRTFICISGINMEMYLCPIIPEVAVLFEKF